MTPTARIVSPLTLALALLAGCAHGPSPKERETASIHYQLGAEALRNGHREEAIKEFDEAARIDPGLAVAYLGKGLCLAGMPGRSADAEREDRKALELDPSLSDARNALGVLLAQNHRLPEALAEFDRALDDPSYANAFVARCNKGQALADLGQRDAGVKELRTCLSQAPRYCAGHRMLGKVFLDGGQVKDAQEQFTRYTEFCPQAADAWYQLGLSRLKLGDPERANEAFERCAGLAGGAEVLECRQKVEQLKP